MLIEVAQALDGAQGIERGANSVVFGDGFGDGILENGVHAPGGAEGGLLELAALSAQHDELHGLAAVQGEEATQGVEILDGAEEVDGGAAEAVELDDDQMLDVAQLEALAQATAVGTLPDGDGAGNVVVVKLAVDIELLPGGVFFAAHFLGADGLLVGADAAVEDGGGGMDFSVHRSSL
jgi:hypothetical protein